MIFSCIFFHMIIRVRLYQHKHLIKLTLVLSYNSKFSPLFPINFFFSPFSSRSFTVGGPADNYSDQHCVTKKIWGKSATFVIFLTKTLIWKNRAKRSQKIALINSREQKELKGIFFYDLCSRKIKASRVQII